LNFVLSQFKGKEADQGIGIDLFFGGGMDSFIDMENAGVLQPLPSDYGVPATLNGVPLRGKDNAWVAAALGGFGILYNKTIAQRDNLPVPATWADMANPKLQDRIALADPRHSGSAHMAYEIILQANGWEKGLAGAHSHDRQRALLRTIVLAFAG
jgi:ABC-type Fe3+ transport system substrate-binding protein